MIHNHVKSDNSGDHWGASTSGGALGLPANVLAQLQAGGEQVRLTLTPEQAEEFAQALLFNAQRARQTEAQRQAQEPFKPSTALVDLVLARVRDQLDDEDIAQARRVFATHLRNAVLGLLSTLAGSLRLSGKPAPHPIATQAAGIDPNLHAAIFARVLVAPEQQVEFLSLLATELSEAAGDGRVWGPYWGLHKSVQGELNLVLWTEPLSPTWPRQRAKSVKMRLQVRADKET